MTVVLAAVLYLLVTSLTAGGPSTTPIGGAFLASHPVSSYCATGSAQTLGASAISGGCTAGDFVYTLTIESSRVAFGNVLFKVETPTGAVFAGAGASASFAVIDLSSHVVAVSITGPALAMTAKWSGYGPTLTAPAYTSSSPLTNQFEIVIDLGHSAPATGEGLEFVVVGIGSFSGATTPLGLP